MTRHRKREIKQLMTLEEYKKYIFDDLRDCLSGFGKERVEAYINEITEDVEFDYKDDIERSGFPTPVRHMQNYELCFE